MSKLTLRDEWIEAKKLLNSADKNERIAVANHDTRAFGDRIYPYLEKVFSYVIRRVGSAPLAEDIVSDTFKDALQNHRKFRQEDPYCWLLGIARRKVADAFRSKRRRGEIRWTDPKVEAIATSNGNPHTILEDTERANLLRSLVMRLSQDQREALLLQHLEDLTQYEVAAVMNKSVQSVNSLQQRARKNLHKWGYQYFDDTNGGMSL